MRISEGILNFLLRPWVVIFLEEGIGLSRNVITRLDSWLGLPIHFLERATDGIEVQEFKVVQGVVQSVVLVKVAADEGGKMDETRVDEGPRCVPEDDCLEFRDRKEESELNEVGDEVEPAGEN